jgi:hypothetical protein
MLCQYFRDRRRQSRFPVINVPDRPDIHMRFASIKFLFAHLLNFSPQFSIPNFGFAII